MPRKSLDVMTESMFYTIMAFQAGPQCGIEIASYVEELTGGRVQLGPGTLYTILSKFQEVGYLKEIAVEGRKRTYELTAEGRQAYASEMERLEKCIGDARRASNRTALEGGAELAGEGQNVALAPVPAL